jgi:hypothetical protein
LYTKLEKLQNELEVPENWSVYDRCTIKAVVECFWSFWSFGESISCGGSIPAVGSNPALTAKSYLIENTEADCPLFGSRQKSTTRMRWAMMDSVSASAPSRELEASAEPGISTPR